jgi:hypothetical protein
VKPFVRKPQDVKLLNKINLRWSEKQLLDYYHKCNGGSAQFQGRKKNGNA